MRITFMFLSALVLSIMTIHASNITATQTGMVDFQVYANLSENDMNGTNDVSDKLQQAINYARDQFKTLFIPSGTYLVSKPIDCISTNQSNHKGHGAIIIVGSQKQRPLIKLKDNSPAFQGTGMPSQTNGPRPVFGLRNVDFPSKNADWLFYTGIRSLDIDLGWGNPGAIGLSWASAQNCFVEEITIRANDGFAGMAGLPGANALTVNVDVHGGRYGFYLTRNEDNKTLWAQASTTNIVGCRLYNQSENAMRINGWGGVTLVGLQIVKVNGTALWLSGGSNPNSCPLALIDARIEFVENQAGNRALDNSGRSTIGMINVFTRNVTNISFNNNTTENLSSDGETNAWTHIERYHYVDKTNKTVSSTSMPGRHFVNGALQSADIIEQKPDTPPDDLISRHIWPFTPSFEDDDVVLVTTAGGNHRQRIQEAIDNNEKVMLGAGTYTLDGPVVLRDSTILFGSPGMRVIFVSASSWVPNDHTWIIDTDDAADATTYLFEVSTDPLRNHFWGGIRWRAGRNSIVRNINNGRTSGGHERNIKRVHITGSGGGRWYNYADHKNLWDNPEVDPNHRKINIEGTSQPLTFYGLNLERGGGYKGVVSSFPMCEIKDAANVRIFGGKSETYQPYARISNSNNIFLANIHDWCIHNKSQSAQPYIIIEGESSANIEIMNAQWNLPPNTSYKIVKDPWHEETPHRSMHMGLYQVGKVDFEPFKMQGMELTVKKTVDADRASWLVFPNPTQNGLVNIVSSQVIGNVAVFDVSGKLIMNKDINDLKGHLELRNPGFYVLRSDGFSYKIIVK